MTIVSNKLMMKMVWKVIEWYLTMTLRRPSV